MMFGPDIKAVVFDMDGVLWHSSEIHAAAYRVVLEEAGLKMPDYAGIAGRRSNEVMRELVAAQRPTDANVEITAGELTLAKQALARRLLRERSPVAAGCAAVMDALAREKRLALASSASAATVDLFLTISGTRPFFKAVISGDAVAAAKPAPDIYAMALRNLACAPDAAAVVEDAPSGIEAAHAAGIAFVVGVEGTVARERLVAAGAKHVIGDLRELLT
jgi:HAD superfamily hydrolase (TIGR01509 family)